MRLLVPFVRFCCDVREGLCPEPGQPSKPTLSTRSLRCRDAKNSATANMCTLPKCGCSPVFYSGKSHATTKLSCSSVPGSVRLAKFGFVRRDSGNSGHFVLHGKCFIIGPTPFTPFTRTNRIRKWFVTPQGFCHMPNTDDGVTYAGTSILGRYQERSRKVFIAMPLDLKTPF